MNISPLRQTQPKVTSFLTSSAQSTPPNPSPPSQQQHAPPSAPSSSSDPQSPPGPQIPVPQNLVVRPSVSQRRQIVPVDRPRVLRIVHNEVIERFPRYFGFRAGNGDRETPFRLSGLTPSPRAAHSRHKCRLPKALPFNIFETAFVPAFNANRTNVICSVQLDLHRRAVLTRLCNTTPKQRARCSGRYNISVVPEAEGSIEWTYVDFIKHADYKKSKTTNNNPSNDIAVMIVRKATAERDTGIPEMIKYNRDISRDTAAGGLCGSSSMH
ncbi:hypothetical protein BJ742DRAFT_742065 [Cladochytrium replicatum]|nr:hypothetical protein BJ742DRAFT_742065 [Cladochytrium replicatum]